MNEVILKEKEKPCELNFLNKMFPIINGFQTIGQPHKQLIGNFSNIIDVEFNEIKSEEYHENI